MVYIEDFCTVIPTWNDSPSYSQEDIIDFVVDPGRAVCTVNFSLSALVEQISPLKDPSIGSSLFVALEHEGQRRSCTSKFEHRYIGCLYRLIYLFDFSWLDRKSVV